MPKLITLLALILITVGGAQAADTPRGLKTDNRVKIASYDPNQVFVINGHYDFQTTIQFHAEEEIQSLSLGDSIGWQVTPMGTLVNVKPQTMNGSTNLTIITTQRTYLFELREGRGNPEEEAIFLLKFRYPGIQDADLTAARGYTKPSQSASTETSPGSINLRYEARGAPSIVPKRVFDDGQFTFLEFGKSQEIPAIYAVRPDQTEAIMNFRQEGQYVVVEGIRPQFTLRQGDITATIFNNAWTEWRDG